MKRIFTEEHRRKLSEAKKGNKNALGNKNWLGKKHSEESKLKMSRVQKGKVIREEVKEKISNSVKKLWQNPEYREKNKTSLGLKHTDEFKKKMSEFHKGNKWSLGKTSWNKGLKGTHLNEETKKKISKALKGNKNCLGNKASEETKLRMSIERKGKSLGKMSEETKLKISKTKSGKVFSIEERLKLSELVPKGKDHWNWKNGVTNKNRLCRNSLNFKLWREKVFKRDNHTCQMCNKRGGKLHPHHIKSFAKYPERRFWVSNGITLCEDCHKKTDTYLRNVKEIEQMKLEFKEVI